MLAVRKAHPSENLAGSQNTTRQRLHIARHKNAKLLRITAGRKSGGQRPGAPPGLAMSLRGNAVAPSQIDGVRIYTLFVYINMTFVFQRNDALIVL